MKFEAEVISEELLPAVRSMLATNLHSDYGLKQKEIAEAMDLTQPAVSQYLNNQRADQEVIKKLKKDPQIMILIEDASEKLAKNEKCREEISDMLRTVRSKGLMKEKFKDASKL